MRKSEGGLWTLTLFAANEIPSVVVTFVALIIFLQMGNGVALSTLFASLLLLPWVMQPLMRRLLPGSGGGRLWLHFVELLLAGIMALFALTMTFGMWWTVSMMALISTLSAWHDLLARNYYRCRTMYAEKPYHAILRTMSAQMATVLTYGLMIMAVGVLQIYFRNRAITYSWALGCYILAGVYLFLTLMNVILLRSVGNPPVSIQQQWPWMQERWLRQMFFLVIMLLPQGLMFFSRTIFLLTKHQHGGLGCTLQEIGFAQGTIGVIAFLAGVAMGRTMQNKWGEARMDIPLALCIGLSPVVYLIMTQWKPEGVWMLSVYTFMAQMFFGMGLNACRKYIEGISGERYRNAVNPLYIPVISLCILLPMVLSGFMLERMTFEQFFLFDALCAVPILILVAIRLVRYACNARKAN